MLEIRSRALFVLAGLLPASACGDDEEAARIDADTVAIPIAAPVPVPVTTTDTVRDTVTNTVTTVVPVPVPVPVPAGTDTAAGTGRTGADTTRRP